MKKKTFVLLLCLALAASQLTACMAKKVEPQPETAPAEVSEISEEETQALPEETAAETEEPAQEDQDVPAEETPAEQPSSEPEQAPAAEPQTPQMTDASPSQTPAEPAPEIPENAEVIEVQPPASEDPAPVSEEPAPEEPKSIADGTYTVSVGFSGGSGRASVDSPTTLYVNGGSCYALITWSSPWYDYMIVNGVKYTPINSSGNSQFKIPVVLDTYMKVIGDTTAMSVPHEIEYTLYFDSSSIR